MDKAKQKLAEAGHPNGLKFSLLVPNNPEHQLEAQVLQAQLAKVGLDAQIDVKDTTTATSMSNAGDFEAFIFRWSGYLDPHRNLFMPYHLKGYGSAKHYNTPEADVLLDKAAKTTNNEERAKLYQEAEKLMVENSPLVWLFYYMENMATKKNVKGLKAMPSRYYTTRFFKNAWFTQ